MTSTLESLYRDRIKPNANYIKGRLKERACPEALLKSFVEYYSQHTDLFHVQAAPTDETAIFFVAEPSWFEGWVDIDSAEDPYDEEFWQEMEAYLEGGQSFAGGRYGMARDLMQRNLDFLAPFCLGEVCHIVQLAITQRKIIVYHRKMLRSMNLANGKEAGTPASEGADEEQIKDFPQLCRAVFKTLRRHSSGIRLARLKQMIQEESSCKLNEMTFRCTKLIELFRLEPLRSTFCIEEEGNTIILRAGDPKLFPEDIRRIHAEVHME